MSSLNIWICFCWVVGMVACTIPPFALNPFYSCLLFRSSSGWRHSLLFIFPRGSVDRTPTFTGGYVHTRDTYLETGDLAQLPAQLAGRWEQINWNSVRWQIIYYVLGRLEQTRQGKNSCTSMTSPRNQPRKDPFICTPRVPVCLIFNVSRGHPSLVSPVQALHTRTCILYTPPPWILCCFLKMFSFIPYRTSLSWAST
jgi:hypothetical protein